MEEPEDPDNPDIDLTTGAHFTVTLNEPGSLKQRLTNAVFQTDIYTLSEENKIENGEVSVSQAVTDDTDLTGTMLGNVYVTLDTEDSDDGYNASEGCIVINSTTGEDALAASTSTRIPAASPHLRLNKLTVRYARCSPTGVSISRLPMARNMPSAVYMSGSSISVLPCFTRQSQFFS